MRRIIIIVGIVITLAIIGIGLYFLFFIPKATTNTPGANGSLPPTGNQIGSSQNSTTTGSSNGNRGGFGIIFNEPILDYFVNNANIANIIEPNGNIIQIINGKATTSSDISMQNILSANFSYDGTKILMSFGDPANPQASVFDITKQTWTPLPAGLQSPVWSPTDYRVAYTKTTPQGVESFATIDASKANSTPVVITTLHAQDLTIAWPTKNQMVFYTKPSAYVTGSALTYNLQSGILAPIATEVPGLTMQWSDTSFIPETPMGLELINNSSNLGGSLALMDISGNTLQQLRFLTLPSKCSFVLATSTPTTSSTPYLYCGIPRDQNTLSTSHLPDDYNQMSLFTSDDIYRIDLQTGETDTIFDDASQNMDVSDLKFFNNTVFFINRYDQKLYGLQLVAAS